MKYIFQEASTVLFIIIVLEKPGLAATVAKSMKFQDLVGAKKQIAKVPNRHLLRQSLLQII